MPDAVAETLRAGVKTWLDTIDGATVLREPNRELGDSELPAIIVLDGEDEQVDDQLTGWDRWTAYVTIGLAVSNSDSDDARAAATQNLLGSVRQKMTLSNLVAQIGTFIEEVRQGQPITAESLDLGAVQMVAGMEYEIDFVTVEDDPFTSA